MITNLLTLNAGLDRTRAREEGGSVRHLVVELAAQRATTPSDAPALDMALAIDVSDSMAGRKSKRPDAQPSRWRRR